MSTCADVGSFIESKTTEVQTSNVGFTSEVSDYLVVYTGPEWCISSIIYSGDTPFWSGTLDFKCDDDDDSSNNSGNDDDHNDKDENDNTPPPPPPTTTTDIERLDSRFFETVSSLCIVWPSRPISHTLTWQRSHTRITVVHSRSDMMKSERREGKRETKEVRWLLTTGLPFSRGFADFLENEVSESAEKKTN